EWAGTQPEVAAEKVALLPMSTANLEIYHTVAEKWFAKEPADALAWIDTNIPFVQRKELLDTLEISDPTRAQPVLTSLFNGSFGKETDLLVEQASEVWAREDPQAFVEWVRQMESTEAGLVDNALAIGLAELARHRPEDLQELLRG